MQAIKIVSRLETQVQDAILYHNEAVRNIELFIEKMDEIYEGGEWKQYHSNWEVYCRECLPKGFGASNIRHMKKEVYIHGLIENVSGLTPIKREVKMIGEVVHEVDRRMIPRVYQVAHHLNQGEPIAKRHFKAVYDVEKQLQITGAVSLNGEATIPTDLAMLGAHMEAFTASNKEYQAHRSSGNKQSIAATATKRANGDYTITSDDILPSEFEFKLWIAKDDKE